MRGGVQIMYIIQREGLKSGSNWENLCHKMGEGGGAT